MQGNGGGGLYFAIDIKVYLWFHLQASFVILLATCVNAGTVKHAKLKSNRMHALHA